jgi:hypothetical protein
MNRALIVAVLLLACDRQRLSTGNWTLGPPDAGPPVQVTDGKGNVGSPPVAPDDRASHAPDASNQSISAPDARSSGPAADFAPDAGPHDAPMRSEPPVAALGDGGSDVAADARACPESGPCD